MIMPIKIREDWTAILTKRKRQAQQSVDNENKKRLEHTYKVGDQILVNIDPKTQHKLGLPTRGPYTITDIYDTGAVKVSKGNYTEKFNIRRIKPLH